MFCSSQKIRSYKMDSTATKHLPPSTTVATSTAASTYRQRNHLHSHNHNKLLWKALVCLAVVLVFNLSQFDINFRLGGEQAATFLPNANNNLKNQPTKVSSLFAEAKVLGKVAKVWYIKKKIKKLTKKLKKHTIAVPVFTAIPIYEHTYYPHAPMQHMHPMQHHHYAASNHVATIADPASAQTLLPLASNNHHHSQPAAHHHPALLHHPHHHNQHSFGYQAAAVQGHANEPAAAAHIINSYAPSPPMFVDNTGGIYGHYNNAFGHRYNGGYQAW